MKRRYTSAGMVGFSALQRAENSSKSTSPARPHEVGSVSVLFSEPKIPQRCEHVGRQHRKRAFQCSSASRKFLKPVPALGETPDFGFQCSSASRKFLKAIGAAAERTKRAVSVLFSEPKIPQSVPPVARVTLIVAFQCSSASRKFLKAPTPLSPRLAPRRFQCSSASRKFLKSAVAASPQFRACGFQCSSASRKFLK